MAERKLSAVTRGEMQDANEALRMLFERFCAFGAGQRGQSGLEPVGS